MPSACSASGSAGSRFRWAASAPIAALGGDAPAEQGVRLHAVRQDLRAVRAAKGFFLSGDAYDVGVFALFLFQMVFMDTTATIPTGAMAERWKWSVVHGLRLLHVDGRLPALRQLGLGRRLARRARRELRPRPRPRRLRRLLGRPHGRRRRGPRRRDRARAAASASSTRTASRSRSPGTTSRWRIVGTFILAFGWFGFNPGSTLAGTDLRIAVVAVNTMLAGDRRRITAMLYMWWQVRQARPVA